MGLSFGLGKTVVVRLRLRREAGTWGRERRRGLVGDGEVKWKEKKIYQRRKKKGKISILEKKRMKKAVEKTQIHITMSHVTLTCQIPSKLWTEVINLK